jgi:fatty-acyl-CoA synthase
VPTVMLYLLDHCDSEGLDFDSLRLCVCGGSAVPPALSRRLRERGVEVRQAWGMTETSAISTVCRPPAHAGPKAADSVISKQGQPVPWVELRAVGEDGEVLPSDGESVGELEVRGPWIASGYFNGGAAAGDQFDDGWLRTGDIGTVDELGYMEISDRTRDVVKSGGEWISSVDLENHLIGHEDVVEAAVIARPDERWGERPLACVVLRAGADTGPEELRRHLEPHVAKWWLPDEFAFLDEVPKTSVGKFDKKLLRDRLAAGTLKTG